MRPLVVVISLSALLAQDTPLGPRDMYYHPVLRRAAAAKPVATSFGVRYNLLRFTDKEKDISETVDPDGNFGTHDCFALLLRPNRGGHLYLFNTGSSGRRQILLPNAEMPDEAGMIPAGRTVRVPQKHCFEVDGTRGIEQMRVVVTDEEDVDQVKRATEKDAGTLVAAERLRDEVAGERGMAGRDLVIEKVGQPKTADEPPNSVYVMKPLDKGNRMVFDLKIRHQ